MWIHRINNVDEQSKTGDCAHCGRIPVSYKAYNNSWRCSLAKSQYLKGGGKKPLIVPDSCDICGGGYKISYDHDHRNGRHRGWLCMHCNTALGLVKDSPVVLQKMIDYLAL